MDKYEPARVEKKWREQWAKDRLYKVNLNDSKPKYYLLVELPYPSGDLHMGHWFAFSVPDILARMKRMQDYNVFEPVGFDAFGLPAENAAIRWKIHPREWTFGNIEKMKAQFSTMGLINDWDYEVITCSPEYYKWNQWIFLKLYEKGLAYRGKILSNWCPVDQTVLANENVENGKCWRCGAEVVQKEVEQWFFKITDYAERLLWEDPPQADWPRSLIESQNNWIGKSKGLEIEFKVKDGEASVRVFTKFPETIFGVTYMVLAPEHPLLSKLTTTKYEERVNKYIKQAQRKSELERTSLEKKKTGVFTGSYVINPVNGKEVPVWVSDYVIGTYGTGAVMGVPGSDIRDFHFAEEYDIEVIRVIGSKVGEQSQVLTEKDVLEEGYIVNSGQFDDLASPEIANEKISEFLVKNGWAEVKVNYHVHDWSVSRQRYWGTPIPIIYCDNCGIVPVSEKDLPVELPDISDYQPHGKPPLATAEDWVKVKCPSCGEEAKREVETMDTFVDSAWYFLRYLDPKNDKEIFDKGVVSNFTPVDIYFGGAEHSVGHTLYSRFFVKFFKDLGLVGYEEYAQKRVHHGVILGPDGSRMSKSKGNVVNPDEQVEKYGADAVRMYLAFMGPYDLVAPWNPSGIKGVYHFLERVWRLGDSVGEAEMSDEDKRMMNRAIKKVTEDVEDIKFNTAVSTLMEWLNHLMKKDSINKSEFETFLRLLAPFAPHITEEIWQNLFGNSKSKTRNPKFSSIHNEKWPEFDESQIGAKTVTLIVQINGRVRDKVQVEAGINQKEAEKLALSLADVQKNLGKKAPRKVIYVQDRLVNFVV
ncbi:MAG: leucine--tRNA ligase [Candidatus Curtissbacteria bacterium]|nr:leucine--tRNA ligase [Candidatus Curtissbacteria bacterium]